MTTCSSCEQSIKNHTACKNVGERWIPATAKGKLGLCASFTLFTRHSPCNSSEICGALARVGFLSQWKSQLKDLKHAAICRPTCEMYWSVPTTSWQIYLFTSLQRLDRIVALFCIRKNFLKLRVSRNVFFGYFWIQQAWPGVYQYQETITWSVHAVPLQWNLRVTMIPMCRSQSPARIEKASIGKRR